MIGYICKYAPIEIFEAMGEECFPIAPLPAAIGSEEGINISQCSFIKAVFNEIKRKGYDGVLLTSCCDSTRRLYDILTRTFPDRFIYLLDIPRYKSNEAIALYKARIMDMINAYEAFSGKCFSEKALKLCSACKKPDPSPVLSEKRPNVVLAGARMNPQIKAILAEKDVNIAADFSCTGIERAIAASGDDLLLSYSESLLEQYPCMRMAECGRRFQSGIAKADGIIYHTVQFCDMYSFEYSSLRFYFRDIPVLSLDTDYTSSAIGQVRTRIEAFLEEMEKGEKMKINREGRYVIGIDSGSTSTNGVLMDIDGCIVCSAVIPTGAKSSESAYSVYSRLLSDNGLSDDDIMAAVATGYGRDALPFSSASVTEISCHAKGAHHINPDVRTLLDIGGQDSKAIRIGDNGEVLDFAMNDKCAAGTGRFLESIARTLELPIELLGDYALKSEKEIEITSMCTVFAESEVISLIADNNDIEDIASAVCSSIASKSISLMKRVGIDGAVMMSGGVARNKGVVRALERKLERTVLIPDSPDLVGAIGAALFALEAVRNGICSQR